MSFNLEGYMWDKQKEEERKDISVIVPPTEQNINNIGDHISIISETKLRDLGDRFMKDYFPGNKKRI